MCAGAKLTRTASCVTNGGRVLGVTATAHDSAASAVDEAYALRAERAVSTTRTTATDIGQRALKALEQ